MQGQGRSCEEQLAVEAPLEIRLRAAAAAARSARSLTVTMRTPGHDAELALGLLIAEGVIDRAAQVASLRHCGGNPNILWVELAEGVEPRLQNIERTFASTASCGLCGKTSIDSLLEALSANAPRRFAGDQRVEVAAATLTQIPMQLRARQGLFDSTGGLHAVAAFSLKGECLAVFEDIGRHNAFDKLVGAMQLAGKSDLRHCIVALSGRAGFELLQKAAVARAPVVVALGAPSSLAVEVAERAGITLVGFLRQESFNIYTHPQLVALKAVECA